MVNSGFVKQAQDQFPIPDIGFADIGIETKEGYKTVSITNRMGYEEKFSLHNKTLSDLEDKN